MRKISPIVEITYFLYSLLGNCFGLDPVFIGFIRFDRRDPHDTGDIILVSGEYSSLESLPVLDSSLVESDYLTCTTESPIPPVHTLDREKVGTSDEMRIQEIGSQPESFRLGWMCYIDKEEGHNYFELVILI
jgi:hypothetical protein